MDSHKTWTRNRGAAHTENLRFFTAPTLGTGMEGSQSVVYPDWASLEQLALHLQNDTVDQYEPTGR